MIFNGNRVLVKENEHHIIERELKDKGQEFVPVRSLLTVLPEDEVLAVLENYLKYNYKSRSQFCGFCGSKTVYDPKDNSYECSQCHEKLFPPVFPAIIVSVIKDDKILLAHNERFPGNMHSVLAGFVDQRESLEECVEREVLEEVGVKVKNIRYVSSQFWGFTTSLMIGFTAEYDSGDIVPDGVEIDSANWFSYDDLPEIPPKMSLARTLIDKYIEDVKKG